MVTHMMTENGAAKCGCNVYIHHEWDEVGNVVKEEKRVSHRKFIYFAKDTPATCKRCNNQIARPEICEIPENWKDLVFHYSFGYDMTINEYARPIERTAKGLVCQKCHTVIVDGDPWGNRGDGRAAAGNVNEKEPHFLMTLKKSKWGSQYWTGAGEHWSVWDGKPDYENHCD